MWACPINVRSCHQQISSPIKMLFILCFLSYLILHFRTYHCLGSKETTTWTTYAYSDCCVVQGKLPPLSLGCQTARRRWPGGSMRNILRIHTNYDFIDLNSVSVIAVKCARSCYMGLRYNATLVISFMNVMPVLWHVPLCVCVWHTELLGCSMGENWPR